MLKMFKRKQDPRAGLAAVLGEFELPGFPMAVMEVLRSLRDPEKDLESIATRVETDPGMSVGVLKMVNSAAFGLASEVDTVGHGLAMLGRARLESLVLGVVVRDVLPKEPAAGFESARFWSTAARRATMARLLASRLHPATEEQSFTSALLQDMAVPVLASVKGEAYGSVLEAWHAQGDAALEHLEHEAFQWDHAEIGSMMATLWELPTPLVGGIGGHHDADEDDAEPAVQLVGHLREAETEAGLERLASDAEARFGIDRAEITDLSQRAEEQADELAALMK